MRYLFDSSRLLLQGLAIWLVWPSLRSASPNLLLSSRAPSIGGAFALVLLGLALAIGADWWALPYGERAFVWQGSFALALACLPLIFVSWIASRRVQNLVPDVFGQIVLRLVAALVLYIGFRFALDVLVFHMKIPRPTAGSLRIVLAIWFAVASALYVNRMVSLADWVARNLRWWLVGLSSMLILAATPYLLHQKFLPRFWVDLKAELEQPTLASERTLNNQALLFTQQMKDLKPQRPGNIDVYFVGYAPDATQDVFKLELNVIHRVMNQRFDTAGRSLRLQNHSTTLSTYPIATESYLNVAIEQMAALMDTQEDVFVLYLTSHGNREHDLIPKFPPMALEPITPSRLRAMLDRHKIKHRVIIVSACYSGGFIEPLKSPDTLVMTASAKDRTSFGCSNESDFTYFGKAIFDEQLRKTLSFEQAFTNALPIIAEREKKITDVLSNPQIAVGDNIRVHLKKLETQLQAPKTSKPN
jgi:ABC-type nickel/cobalt efflux system permease component RcnA